MGLFNNLFGRKSVSKSKSTEHTAQTLNNGFVNMNGIGTGPKKSPDFGGRGFGGKGFGGPFF